MRLPRKKTKNPENPNHAAAQVCAHDWAATRGGLVPRLLGPGVARGAATVASVRRLRNMVHGVVALKQLRRRARAHDSPMHPFTCWLCWPSMSEHACTVSVGGGHF